MTTERRRRRRVPIGGSRGTQAEGAVNDGSDDQEMEGLNEAVAAQAMQEPQETPVPQREAYTPQSRMQEVGARAGAYEREYRLQLLHRLLMRRLPLDQIAQELQCSVRTIIRDRTELYDRLRKQAAGMDANHLIGDTLGFYSEVQGMALRAASQSKTPMNIRLAALRTALSSKNDSHRFMQASGIFDVLQFKASENKASNDIDKLMEMTEKLLSSDDELADDTNIGPEYLLGMDSMGLGGDDDDEELNELRIF